MDPKFNLDNLYLEYTKKIKLDKLDPNSIQAKETKQTFMAACGIMLITMRDDISAIEDENMAVMELQSMLDQVGNFFLRLKGQSN